MSYDPITVERRFDERKDPVPLLDALQRLVLERLPSALDRALARADDYLFDRSQSGDEVLGLAALRDLRQARTQIARRFEQVVRIGFQILRDPLASAPQLDHSSMQLLPDDDLDEHLASEQLAENLTRTHIAALEVLGKRMAVLLGREVLATSDDPLTPTFLAGALRKAAGVLQSDEGVRIVLFKFLERELGPALGQVYDRANGVLAGAGILPHLRVGHRADRAASESGRAGESGHAADAGSVGVAAMSHPSPADQATFATMLNLLQGWRTASAAGAAGQAASGPAQTLSSNELMTILSLLQADLPGRLKQEGRREQSLASQLRSEMVQGAKKLGATSDNLQLDGLDEDAVDLVALLFDVLLDGPQFDPDIRRMIGRMLVPYVKVAVKDRRLFLFKEHPARRLLNTVAEACEGNRGEAPQEREILSQVDHTIDRLVAEFNEDVAIFEALEQELRAYLAQSRKRVELAEKRATESQRGRERLDHARSAVNAALAQHRGERLLPAVIDSFINRYAAHHLVQVMLRDGHGSPRFEESMLAVEDVLLAFDHAELRTPVAELPALPRKALLEILSSSGCTGEPAEQALASLQDAMVRLAHGEHAAEITNRMPEQVIPPEPPAVTALAPVALQLIAGTDTLDFDASVLGRMRKLKVGDWIQLETGVERIEPAKVSWISPISGRLLLVNRRGIRVLVAAPEELAAMAKLGKATVREGDTMFDDAMHQVVDRLKAASRGPAAG
jgi:hypothetical protein